MLSVPHSTLQTLSSPHTVDSIPLINAALCHLFYKALFSSLLPLFHTYSPQCFYLFPTLFLSPVHPLNHSLTLLYARRILAALPSIILPFSTELFFTAFHKALFAILQPHSHEFTFNSKDYLPHNYAPQCCLFSADVNKRLSH